MILDMDVDTVVPGHGPVTDKAGVRKVKDYFTLVETESRRCYDAGITASDAARDFPLGEFADWGGAERIVVNVRYFYRRFSGDTSSVNVQEGMALMAPLAMRGQRSFAAAG